MMQNDPKAMLDDIAGSFGYIPHEVFGQNPYKGKPADIFALGTLLYIMFNAELPFCESYYHSIMNGQVSSHPSMNSIKTGSQKANIFITDMLCHDSRKRIKIDKVVKRLSGTKSLKKLFFSCWPKRCSLIN